MKKILTITAILAILLGFVNLPFYQSVTPVYADSETAPEGSAPAAEVAAAETPADAAPAVEALADEAAVDEAPASEAADGTPADEEPIGTAPADTLLPDDTALAGDEQALSESQLSGEESTEVAPSVETAENLAAQPVSEEPSGSHSEDLTDVVELISAGDLEIINEQGEALSLTSKETLNVLASSDPFFWNGVEWIGYSVSGLDCPANVTCVADPEPFKRAVAEAGAGRTIYVAGGIYNEDVVINTDNLSFVGFNAVDVQSGVELLTVTTPGYASVRSITLNANFGTTDGVYAKHVIVNGPNGWLDDGLALADVGGTVEADVILTSGGGHYVIKDQHHQANTSYEWECAEPNEVIYPGRNYRMVLKSPTHADVLQYFENHGDERSTLLDYPFNLSGADRLEDLLVGVNLSAQDAWSHSTEERVFWNLLGNAGFDSFGNNITLTAAQQSVANSVTDGTNDSIERKYAVWFLWPMLENGKSVSPLDRQLSFLSYEKPEVLGCTDPSSFNFNPRATKDSGSCEYACEWNPEIGASSPNCHKPTGDPKTPGTPTDPGDPQVNVVIVPGTADEALIIPVTGADLGTGMLLPLLGLLLTGFALLGKGIYAWVKNK